MFGTKEPIFFFLNKTLTLVFLPIDSCILLMKGMFLIYVYVPNA